MRLRAIAVAVLMLAFSSTSFAYQNSVWIPPWISSALTSVQENGSAIDESNPVWYAWNADGTIAKNWNAENATWRAAMTGSRIVPTVQNVINKAFNGTLAASVLADPARRDAHASAITQLAIQNAYDGIDVDYEKVPSASRADFTAFVQSLAAKLHAAGKTLSVTVYAKTSDSQNWNGPGSQDWAAIGRAADSVKIMAYDYHWTTSAAGAITPLDWLDKVATYAQSAIPSAKIMMGLPWYGYDWVGSSGTGVSYNAATTIARNNNVSVTRDASGEATFAYADHTVYFQDAASYKAKLDALKAKHSSIGGFAHWAAGQEDPAVWTVMRGGAVTTAPANPSTPSAPVTPAPSVPATPSQPDFTVTGPATVNVPAGSHTTATYSITAINGFASSVRVDAMGSAAVSLDAPLATNAASAVPVAVAVPATTAAGIYQVVIRFTSGSIVREKLVSVVVQAPRAGRRRAA